MTYYTIKCNGNIIAWFMYESDRDTAMDALQAEHQDCRWKSGQATKTLPTDEETKP